MPTVAITEYTDPGCPFAFSAEPHRMRLRWLFGEQLEFSERMVGLADTREHYAEKGLTPEKMAQGAEQLAQKFGMPMSEEPKDAVAATVAACRAVVAARLNAPEKQWLLLRHLRHLHFAGPLLDDPQTIRDAASFVGLDPDELEGWMAEEATERALDEDMLMARDPSPAALALKDKLASTEDDGWRYTCPSYEFRTAEGATFSAPGMQSSLGYETALANIAPDLERRAEPDDVTEVLTWAGFPVATQEVAEVCGISKAEAREKLEAAGAVAEPVGRDAFWTLAA